MNRFLFTLASIVVLIGITRCTDSTIIGGDLLNGNQLPVEFTDTLSIELAAFPGDVSTISSFNLASGAFAVGCIDDPKFGNTRATIGFQLLERDSSLLTLGITIDSVILVLPLDPASQLGDTTSSVSLRVLQAEAGTIEVDEATTDIPLVSTGKVYGEITTVPPRQPTRINFFPNRGDSIRRDSVNPQFRIPLNQDFIDDILPALIVGKQRDTLDPFQDSVFASNFAGLIIEASTCSATMPAVSVTGTNGGRFGAVIYYTRGIQKFQYSLSFFRTGSTSIAFRPVYEHTYAGTGTLAEELLTGSVSADTISLIQSLDGISTRVSLNDLTGLGNVIVSYAILEVPVIQDGFAEPINRLVPKRLNSVGDFIDLGASNATIDAGFTTSEGGLLTKIPNPAAGATDSIEVYRFNLTAHVQKIVDGERDAEIFLLPFARVQIPGRSIIAGPKSTGPQTRLLLATTKLP